MTDFTPITPQQISRIRRKFSLVSTGLPGTYFTNDDIEDVYDEAEGDMTLAYVYILDELMTDAAKLFNYTQNASREEKGKIFDNLLKMRQQYWARHEDQRERGRRQVRLFTLKLTRPLRDTPYEQDDIVARDSTLPNLPDRARTDVLFDDF